MWLCGKHPTGMHSCCYICDDVIMHEHLNDRSDAKAECEAIMQKISKSMSVEQLHLKHLSVDPYCQLQAKCWHGDLFQLKHIGMDPNHQLQTTCFK